MCSWCRFRQPLDDAGICQSFQSLRYATPFRFECLQVVLSDLPFLRRSYCSQVTVLDERCLLFFQRFLKDLMFISTGSRGCHIGLVGLKFSTLLAVQGMSLLSAFNSVLVFARLSFSRLGT